MIIKNPDPLVRFVVEKPTLKGRIYGLWFNQVLPVFYLTLFFLAMKLLFS